MILFNEDELARKWVERQLDISLPGPVRAFGFMVAGKLGGGIVYHDYNERHATISASIATTTPAWATKGHLRFVLWYPFGSVGVQRFGVVTRQKNKRAQNFLRRLGFTYEGNARRAFRDDNGILYGMLREEWVESPWHYEVIEDGRTGWG